MDYFTDVLAILLCLDRDSILAVYGGLESLIWSYELGNTRG